MSNENQHQLTRDFYFLLRNHTNDCLPEDLLVKILYRFPVKFLLMCKSVSKSWCRLINTPFFVQTHLLYSSSKAKTENAQLVFIYELRVPRLYILKDKLVSSSSPWKQRVEFSEYNTRQCSPQPCRGLLSFTTNFSPEAKDKITIVAINPATREFHELPKLGPIEDRHGLSYIIFDSSSNTYKVLWLSMIRDVCKMVSVINLVDDISWRKVVVPTDAEEGMCWAFPSLNHPVPYLCRSSECFPSKIVILIFDAEHENFLTLNFSHVIHATQPSISTSALTVVAACQGSIFLFLGCDASTTNNGLNVWVMKDYKISETWVKESSFNLQFLFEGTSHDMEEEGSLFHITLHGVIDHGIVLKIETDPLDGVFAIYDIIKKTLQRYEIADEELAESMVRRPVKRGEFYESLVSPKLGY